MAGPITVIRMGVSSPSLCINRFLAVTIQIEYNLPNDDVENERLGKLIFPIASRTMLTSQTCNITSAFSLSAANSVLLLLARKTPRSSKSSM